MPGIICWRWVCIVIYCVPIRLSVFSHLDTNSPHAKIFANTSMLRDETYESEPPVTPLLGLMFL